MHGGVAGSKKDGEVSVREVVVSGNWQVCLENKFEKYRKKLCNEVLIMSILGNIMWLIFGGFLSGLGWLIAGLLWCITVVGIPVGVQCFKLAGLSFCPFGKEVVHGGGAGSFLLNVLWFIFSGLELAICNFLLGCLLCVTIVGIPFGKQFFKIAGLSLAPFGAEVH